MAYHKWSEAQNNGGFVLATLQENFLIKPHNLSDICYLIYKSSYENEELTLEEWYLTLNKICQEILLDCLEKSALTTSSADECSQAMEIIELLQNIQSNK